MHDALHMHQQLITLPTWAWRPAPASAAHLNSPASAAAGPTHAFSAAARSSSDLAANTPPIASSRLRLDTASGTGPAHRKHHETEDMSLYKILCLRCATSQQTCMSVKKCHRAMQKQLHAQTAPADLKVFQIPGRRPLNPHPRCDAGCMHLLRLQPQSVRGSPGSSGPQQRRASSFSQTLRIGSPASVPE